MAIYHYSHKPVSRGAGRSAVAGAAYRAAEKLHDRSVGQTFDYSRRSGVLHAEIVLPTQAVKRDINWPRNRQALWNAAEAAEKRKDARVAREHEVALPHELTKSQQIVLVRAFASEIANRYNVAVDFALHRPHWSGDSRNYHAHIFATTREITPMGLGPKASIELSDTDRFKRGLESGRKEITAMRARWEEITNEHLRERGIEARIDHRSLETQGIERTPTAHLGPAMSEMRRRGLETHVEQRIAWRERETAQQRLDRAAELGRIEGEQRALARSILDLSGDIERAKRERDLALVQQAKPSPAQSLDELQRRGREAWRELRERDKAEELVRTQKPERSKDSPRRVALVLTIDEQRAQAREAWRQWRERESLAPGAERNQSLEQERDRAPELEGPEHEP